MAKHVEPIVADWRTGVQIPPAPPNKQKKTSSDVFFCACAPTTASTLRWLPSDRRHGPVYQQIHRISRLQTAQGKAALGAQSGAAECITNLGLARAQQQGGLKGHAGALDQQPGTHFQLVRISKALRQPVKLAVVIAVQASGCGQFGDRKSVV